MTPFLKKFLISAVLLGSVLWLAGHWHTSPARAPSVPPLADPMQPFYGARIQRTMTLLATSTPLRQNPVRIICIGQSIMEQGYVPQAIAQLCKEQFPSAQLTLTNLAVGGRTGEGLIRQLHQELLPAYPDLVVFHVYDVGDQAAIERIVSDIRRTTTAEILLWTHHYDNFGTDGTERDAGRENASQFRRYLAQKYNAELVELRRDWQAYLQEHHLPRATLLRDMIHLSPAGGALMAELVMRHFQFNSLYPNQWMQAVRTYEVRHEIAEGPLREITFSGAPWPGNFMQDAYGGMSPSKGGVTGSSAGTSLRLRFHGNRVDLIAHEEMAHMGTAKILIDGRPPSAHAAAYAVTMPLRFENPALTASLERILVGAHPVAEDWALDVSDLHATDGKAQYHFTLTGSVSGTVLSGTEQSGAVRASGDQLSFDTSDLFLRPPGEGWPASTTLHFRTVLMGVDTYAPQPGRPPGAILPVTLVQGLTNAEHTLEIIPQGDGPVPVSELVVYRPPLE